MNVSTIFSGMRYFFYSHFHDIYTLVFFFSMWCNRVKFHACMSIVYYSVKHVTVTRGYVMRQTTCDHYYPNPYIASIYTDNRCFIGINVILKFSFLSHLLSIILYNGEWVLAMVKNFNNLDLLDDILLEYLFVSKFTSKINKHYSTILNLPTSSCYYLALLI